MCFGELCLLGRLGLSASGGEALPHSHILQEYNVMRLTEKLSHSSRRCALLSAISVTLIPLSRSAPGGRIFAVRVPARQQEEVVALEGVHKMGQGELLSPIKSEIPLG